LGVQNDFAALHEKIGKGAGPMVYEEYGSSIPQKLCLTISHLVAVSLFGWLMFGGGFAHFSRWLSMDLVPGNPTRRVLLFLSAVMYLGRLLLTSFWFIKRKMGWGEAITISVWLYIIYFCFAIWGGTNSKSFGVAGIAGLALYALGSYLNTAAEYQRLRWKQHPENQGKLFTEGLFRYAMHINYFGDVVLFTGIALITGNVMALIIPALMAAMFAGINIPILDRHLSRHYGKAFETYAGKTKKFVPFIY
jgi:protein-S-isoprenylcysteine O-methyltransferase Ste14